MQTNKVGRIEMIDALRGFAVLAILLVHSLDHFLYGYPQELIGWYSWFAPIDKVLEKVLFALFSGKAYVIFAMLFGFTFYVQNRNQQAKGNDFGYRYLWRLVLLLPFAALNSVFFPAGDVLLMFAFVGVVLFIVRKWSNRSILILAIIFLLQPIEWIRLILFLINSPFAIPNFDGVISQMNNEILRAICSENIYDIVSKNLTIGQKSSFLWALNSGRLEQTAGLFLLGFYFGKEQLFVIKDRRGLWIKILKYGTLSFFLFLTLSKLSKHWILPLLQSLGVAFAMWTNISVAFIIISVFVLLYEKVSNHKFIGFLKYYGRMSLTNYIAQSIIGAIIYFPIGLNLVQYCGGTLCVLIAIIVFIAQVYFSKSWLSRCKQGPLESLWHKLTWIKVG